MVVSGCVPAEPDSVSPGAGQGKRRGGKGQGGRVPQEPERKVSSRPDRIGRLSGRFIFPSRRGYDESVYTEVRGENHGDAQRDGIQEGLICVLTCVEPCRTCTAGRKSLSSATTVTPTPWLPWTRRRRWARWQPRCAAG